MATNKIHEAVGVSERFSFEEAFDNAIKALPYGGSDIKFVRVLEITAEVGGFANAHTLRVRAATASDQAALAPVLTEKMDQGMDLFTPNTFALKGKDLEIGYDTNSFTGRPLLGGKYEGKEFHFSGQAIRRKETGIGDLVTVVLNYVFDGPMTTLTLLIPLINLKDNNDSVQFHTEAIITEQLSSLGGPNLIKGVIQNYQFVLLEGTARITVSIA